MSMKLQLPLLLFLLHCIIFAFASDPDPVMDFCIPKSPSHPFSCKNSSQATVKDFTFSGIKFPGNFKKTGFSSIPVNSDVFPGLNTLGVSFVRADFDVGGVNVPHFHPRATEFAFVLEGKVYSGFVDTNNRIFAKVIEKGEVMVFPRGLVHFQMNVGDTPATLLGSFDSQNPGLQKIPNAVFGSGIKEELLEKAFGLNSEELSKLSKRVFTKVTEKGEVMVFPGGLVHFQMNAGNSPATLLGSFDSQNSGLQRIPNAVFGSGIKEELMERAFGMSSEELSKLRKRFAHS